MCLTCAVTCRGVCRWQLAQLCYKAALKLQDDPLVQVREQHGQHASTPLQAYIICNSTAERLTVMLGGRSAWASYYYALLVSEVAAFPSSCTGCPNPRLHKRPAQSDMQHT
jgi:hypothetical protein